MTEQYSQTVEVAVTSKTKAKQWIGIGLVLFSLGFLMLTIFLKWYFVFAFAVILTVGIIYIHNYNNTAKEYIYDFSPKRLVVAKKDVIGRTRRMLSLVYNDVARCGLMEGLAADGDIIACGATHEQGVYQIIYKDGEITRRLLFSPDTYMIALLKETLGEKTEITEAEISEMAEAE